MTRWKPPTLIDMVNELVLMQRDIDYFINATPTSEKRNRLCDANIHIQTAIAELEKAKNEHL